MRATRVAWIALTIVACAGSVEPPPSLPALSLPGMQSEFAAVPIERLARDASDPGSLASLLEDAGYRSGAERTYAGPGERFSLAVTRVLAFEDPQGAETYLSWLREHPSDVLGTAETLAPLDIPGSPFLAVHLPGGCCPKAVPIYLSAWRRGSAVVSVRVSGRGVEPDAVESLVAQLDALLPGPPGA